MFVKKNSHLFLLASLCFFVQAKCPPNILDAERDGFKSLIAQAGKDPNIWGRATDGGRVAALKKLTPTAQNADFYLGWLDGSTLGLRNAVNFLERNVRQKEENWHPNYGDVLWALINFFETAGGEQPPSAQVLNERIKGLGNAIHAAKIPVGPNIDEDHHRKLDLVARPENKAFMLDRLRGSVEQWIKDELAKAEQAIDAIFTWQPYTGLDFSNPEVRNYVDSAYSLLVWANERAAAEPGAERKDAPYISPTETDIFGRIIPGLVRAGEGVASRRPQITAPPAALASQRPPSPPWRPSALRPQSSRRRSPSPRRSLRRRSESPRSKATPPQGSSSLRKPSSQGRDADEAFKRKVFGVIDAVDGKMREIFYSAHGEFDLERAKVNWNREVGRGNIRDFAEAASAVAGEAFGHAKIVVSQGDKTSQGLYEILLFYKGEVVAYKEQLADKQGVLEEYQKLSAKVEEVERMMLAKKALTHEVLMPMMAAYRCIKGYLFRHIDKGELYGFDVTSAVVDYYINRARLAIPLKEEYDEGKTFKTFATGLIREYEANVAAERGVYRSYQGGGFAERMASGLGILWSERLGKLKTRLSLSERLSPIDAGIDKLEQIEAHCKGPIELDRLELGDEEQEKIRIFMDKMGQGGLRIFVLNDFLENLETWVSAIIRINNFFANASTESAENVLESYAALQGFLKLATTKEAACHNLIKRHLQRLYTGDHPVFREAVVAVMRGESGKKVRLIPVGSEVPDGPVVKRWPNRSELNLAEAALLEIIIDEMVRDCSSQGVDARQALRGFVGIYGSETLPNQESTELTFRALLEPRPYDRLEFGLEQVRKAIEEGLTRLEASKTEDQVPAVYKFGSRIIFTSKESKDMGDHRGCDFTVEVSPEGSGSLVTTKAKSEPRYRVKEIHVDFSDGLKKEFRAASSSTASGLFAKGRVIVTFPGHSRFRAVLEPGSKTTLDTIFKGVMSGKHIAYGPDGGFDFGIGFFPPRFLNPLHRLEFYRLETGENHSRWDGSEAGFRWKIENEEAVARQAIEFHYYDVTKNLGEAKDLISKVKNEVFDASKWQRKTDDEIENDVFKWWKTEASEVENVRTNKGAGGLMSKKEVDAEWSSKKGKGMSGFNLVAACYLTEAKAYFDAERYVEGYAGSYAYGEIATAPLFEASTMSTYEKKRYIVERLRSVTLACLEKVRGYGEKIYEISTPLAKAQAARLVKNASYRAFLEIRQFGLGHTNIRKAPFLDMRAFYVILPMVMDDLLNPKVAQSPGPAIKCQDCNDTGAVDSSSGGAPSACSQCDAGIRQMSVMQGLQSSVPTALVGPPPPSPRRSPSPPPLPLPPIDMIVKTENITFKIEGQEQNACAVHTILNLAELEGAKFEPGEIAKRAAKITGQITQKTFWSGGIMFDNIFAGKRLVGKSSRANWFLGPRVNFTPKFAILAEAGERDHNFSYDNFIHALTQVGDDAWIQAVSKTNWDNFLSPGAQSLSVLHFKDGHYAAMKLNRDDRGVISVEHRTSVSHSKLEYVAQGGHRELRSATDDEKATPLKVLARFLHREHNYNLRVFSGQTLLFDGQSLASEERGRRGRQPVAPRGSRGALGGSSARKRPAGVGALGAPPRGASAWPTVRTGALDVPSGTRSRRPS